MKILTVVRDLGPGGTQRVAETCALSYKIRGAQSAVLAYRGAGPRESRLNDNDIRLFVGGTQSTAFERALREAEEWGPDVIHIHRTGYPDPESGSVLIRLASPLRKVMETNVFARYDPSSAGKTIDAHILLSSWCLWKYRRWARRSTSDGVTVVIPNPVETARFFQISQEERLSIRKEWGVPADGIVFGRIGQPNDAKWSVGVIPAFEKIAQSDYRAFLVLAGAPQRLRARIGRLPENVRRRVKLLPFQFGDDALRGIYNGFDVFLHLANIGESFGMVLCEAMLCGLPVITLSTPLKDNSQTEVVRHGVTGLVCMQRKQLPIAMASLAGDEELRHALGRRGRESVLERFSSEAVCDKLFELAMRLQSAGQRPVLKAELEASASFQTSIDSLQLDQQFSNGLGTLAPLTRVAREIVHMPEIYVLWRSVKTGLGALKQCPSKFKKAR